MYSNNKLIVLLLILLVAIEPGESGAFYNVNGTAFYISYPTMIVNWYKAQRYCTVHGMYLATIHTEQQYNIILEIIQKHQITKEHVHFWTSGTDQGHENREYYWTASGSSVTFTYWMPGHPRETSEQSKLCILLNAASAIKYQWHDYNCSSLQWFICQSHLELPQTFKSQHCQA